MGLGMFKQESALCYLFIYFKRCAQAIKNKETWTGYLSLGFYFIVIFVFFLLLCLFPVSFVS